MRDYKYDAIPNYIAEEPRGSAALGISANGMFYDWVLKPMGGRGWALAARVTRIALTVFTGTVLIIAVYALMR